jgi:IS30 family transposase
VSHKQLTPNDRYTINKLRDSGIAKVEIAKILDFHATSIGREIARNTDPMFKGVYNHLVANNLLAERRINSKSKEQFKNITEEVEVKIIELLKLGSSPDVISKRLKMLDGTEVSKNTIYRWINADRANGGKLYAYLPHAGKPYRAKSDASVSKIPGRIGIEHRPAIADAKTEPGHFELDTIFGKDQESFLLTGVDKAHKSVFIRKLPNKKAETVVNAFENVAATTLYVLKTLISDNGSEFTSHAKISEITGADFYFANPYSSWERGLNEHTNGLIRRFFPKGTDFNNVSDEDIAKVEHILNTRGRASLGYKTPNEVFLEYLQAA